LAFWDCTVERVGNKTNRLLLKIVDTQFSLSSTRIDYISLKEKKFRPPAASIFATKKLRQIEEMSGCLGGINQKDAKHSRRRFKSSPVILIASKCKPKMDQFMKAVHPQNARNLDNVEKISQSVL
jgi:hypothetical protein